MRKTAPKDLQEAVPADLAVVAEFVDADELLDAVPAEIQQDHPVELRQEQHAEAAELLQEQLAMAAELLHEQLVDIGDADEMLGAVPAKLAVAAEQVDAAPPLSPRSRPLSSRCRGPW